LNNPGVAQEYLVENLSSENENESMGEEEEEEEQENDDYDDAEEEYQETFHIKNSQKGVVTGGDNAGGEE
jgi:hypothetical protein